MYINGHDHCLQHLSNECGYVLETSYLYALLAFDMVVAMQVDAVPNKWGWFEGMEE